MTIKRLAVITPMLNEQRNIPWCLATVGLVGKRLRSDGIELLHVIVDDGSTDDTAALLDVNDANQEAFGISIRVIRHSRNRGATAAIWTAITQVDADAYVLLLPADMQDPPSVIPDMVTKWRSGHDAVYGVRMNRGAVESRIMVALRNCYYLIIAALSGGTVVANAGTFALADRRIVDELRGWRAAHPGSTPQLSTFIVRFVKNPAIVQFDWQPRRAGNSRYGLLRLIREAWRGIRWCREWRIVCQ
jgi:glycosyltransferase involved in cell wall biosynthesis